MYGLTAQLRRAAISVPSNIAEGHARQHRQETPQHRSIAHASLAEVETQVEIGARLNHGSAYQLKQILDRCVALAQRLDALPNALTRTRS
jgi:four helix bundle protein